MSRLEVKYHCSRKKIIHFKIHITHQAGNGFSKGFPQTTTEFSITKYVQR